MSVVTTTTTSTEFEIVNAKGATIYTSPEDDLARRYARQKTKALGQLEIQEVTRTVTVTRRRVYRTRKPKEPAPAPVVAPDDDLEIPSIGRAA